MRDELKKKAWLLTMLLSLVLLALGFGLGRLLPLEQVDETNQLIGQATEKVLALTQEKQALEQELQSLRSGFDNPAANVMWQFENAFYGLLRFGQGLVFNRELGMDLLDSQENSRQIEVLLSWQGQKRKVMLEQGQKLDLNSGWQLTVAAKGSGWAVVVLQKP